MHLIVIKNSLFYSFEEKMGQIIIQKPMGYIKKGAAVINQEMQEPLEKEGKQYILIYDPEIGKFGFIKDDNVLSFSKQ